MIRVCCVCSLRVKFNIDLSFGEMRRLYWIKFINAYTQREIKSGRVHERTYENYNLIRQILVVYLSQNIYMKYQILDLWNFIGTIEACVHLFIFPVKIKLLKNYQKCSFCPRHFQSLVLYFSLFFFFSWPLLDISKKMFDDKY